MNKNSLPLYRCMKNFILMVNMSLIGLGPMLIKGMALSTTQNFFQRYLLPLLQVVVCSPSTMLPD